MLEVDWLVLLDGLHGSVVLKHPHGRLCVSGPAVGALRLGPRHVGITAAFDLRRLRVSALVETDSPGKVSQLGQFHSGTVTSSAQGRRAGAGGAGIQPRGGRAGQPALLRFICFCLSQDWGQAAAQRGGRGRGAGMEVCPGVVLLTSQAHATFPGRAGMLRGALHCGPHPLALTPSEAHRSGSLPADAALCLQVAGAVVYGCRTSSGPLSNFSSFWVQHPPGTLPGALVLDPDEATVQGQVVSD